MAVNKKMDKEEKAKIVKYIDEAYLELEMKINDLRTDVRETHKRMREDLNSCDCCNK